MKKTDLKPSHRPSKSHQDWLNLAIATSQKSKKNGGSPHPNVQVGAIFVGKNGQELAQATNNFAVGVIRNRPERIQSRKRSLWINCAEQLALCRAAAKGTAVKGASLYVTLHPCATCSGLIAEAGIKCIYIPHRNQHHYTRLKKKWKDSIEIGAAKLKEAGVKIVVLSKPKKTHLPQAKRRQPAG